MVQQDLLFGGILGPAWGVKSSSYLIGVAYYDSLGNVFWDSTHNGVVSQTSIIQANVRGLRIHIYGDCPRGNIDAEAHALSKHAQRREQAALGQ